MPFADPTALTVGESALPRTSALSSLSFTSGQVRFTYFVARKTETVNNLRTATGNVAAAATPTVCRMGIYEEASNGDLTLVGATANDTTLFASTFASYTRAVITPFTKVAGRRYAFALLVVSAATMPQFASATFSGGGAELSVSPRLAGVVSSQADLPASTTAASIAASGNLYYGVATP